MAITKTWSINNIKRMNSDGGVISIRWSCVAKNDTSPFYKSTQGGELKCNYNASSEDFISYESLTENDVLGWVYKSLVEDGETANQAKTRIESECTTKVQAKIDKNTSVGIPWNRNENYYIGLK